MLAATTEKACLEKTGNLLQTVGTLGYWASAKKAQIAKQEVIYLGYKIKQGWRWLMQAIKEAIERGADPDTVTTELERTRNTFEAEYGTVYIGYTATATASGELWLNRI